MYRKSRPKINCQLQLFSYKPIVFSFLQLSTAAYDGISLSSAAAWRRYRGNGSVFARRIPSCGITPCGHTGAPFCEFPDLFILIFYRHDWQASPLHDAGGEPASRVCGFGEGLDIFVHFELWLRANSIISRYGVETPKVPGELAGRFSPWAVLNITPSGAVAQRPTTAPRCAFHFDCQ